MFTGTRTRERPGRSQAPTAQKAEAGRVPSLVGGYLTFQGPSPLCQESCPGTGKESCFPILSVMTEQLAREPQPVTLHHTLKTERIAACLLTSGGAGCHLT